MLLLTLDRLHAAANINRWRGWTKRPYSILEHQLIGAQVMLDVMSADRQLVEQFMVHDMHETEVIGDVPTPDKKMYCNTMFDIACEDFDMTLGIELNLPSRWWTDKSVKWMDRQMLLCENDHMSTRPDPSLHAPDWTLIQGEIKKRLKYPSPNVVASWLQLWGRNVK
jgi:hypothetical protein